MDTRGIRRGLAGLLLATGIAFGAQSLTVAGSAGAESAPAPSYFGTPLPAAWELCVLSGLGARVTSANVTDLDIWQLAEGGSTNNDNSYNPLNTRRDTDTGGNVLPASITPEDFPAFTSWPAGCAATVATITQPNMAPIAAALLSSDQPSPPGFLSLVDTTPWCAPDDGVPCYSVLIALGVDPAPSSAMSLLSDTTASLGAYGQDVAMVGSLQQTLQGEQAQLTEAQAAVVSAEQGVQQALAALRTLAIYDYTSDNTLDNDLNLKQFEAPDQREQLKQYYETVDDGRQVALCAQAEKLLVEDQSHRDQVAASITQTTSALGAARDSVTRAVAKLDGDLGSLQTAGACGGIATVSADSGKADTMVAAIGSCVGVLTS
jgi:hypothetical protein